MDKELLTTRQVAELLGVSKQYIHELVTKGKLTPATARKARQSMWFDYAEVDRFITLRNRRLNNDQ